MQTLYRNTVEEKPERGSSTQTFNKRTTSFSDTKLLLTAK